MDAWRRLPGAIQTMTLCHRLSTSSRKDLITEVGAIAEARHSENQSVMLSVGRMYLRAGMLLEAQGALVSAGKLDGANPEPFRWLGEVLLRRGDATRAEKVLARALQLGDANDDTSSWHEAAGRNIPLQQLHGAQWVATAVASTLPSPSLETAEAARGIFLCYRRDDSAHVTGRIRDRLLASFGEGSVFQDVDDIPLGVDFRRHIETTLRQCHSMVAVIGRNWLRSRGRSGLRLHDEGDFVRQEIAVALQRGVQIVPVLVDGAVMPRAHQLPPDISELSFRAGTMVRRDPDFHRDVDKLTVALRL